MKCDRTCCRGRIGSADGFTDRAFVGYADRAARASRPEASIPLRGFLARNAEPIAAVCGLLILAIYNIAIWRL